MARGRMLSQSVATDKKLNGLSLEAELVYLKTIPHLDRDGLIFGDPMLLWAQTCPRRSELMPKISGLIDELVAAGLVVSYEDKDDVVLFFVGFAKNQQGMRYDREAPSGFGPPPGYTRSPSGLLLTGHTPTAQVKNEQEIKQRTSAEPNPNKLRTNSGLTPDKVQPKVSRSLREVEVEGNSGEVPPPTETPPSAPQPNHKPEKIRGTVTLFDPRQVQAGLLPKGTGKTQIEIWKESFAWVPTAAQIRDMNEKATDLDKWRQVTADCSIKAFRSYPNVLDVYLHGWRDSQELINRKPVTDVTGINMATI